MIRNWEG
ncbi:unnamed protein product [Timema podura]|nr:unnamed protein product [Timema podura]